MTDFTNTTPPSISGSRTAGGTLTANPGVWTPTPSSYTYRWERTSWPGAATTVVGSTGGTYTVTSADVGTYFRVAVTPVLTGIPTGTHWADTTEYATLAANGYRFAVTTVTAGDNTAAATALDAADAAGIQLIIGCYPEPYTWTGSTWTISANGISSLNYFASRASSILALFVFNEPYNVFSYSAAQLRSLRTVIQGTWPAAKIYHDMGQCSFWPGVDNAKWGDQSGTLDFSGSWYYPFKDPGVGTYPTFKSYGLGILATEYDFIKNNIGGGAKMVWLGQSHAVASDNLVYPSNADITDWNTAIRAALPADTYISWYVWRQALYSDYLVNHPTQWSLITS